MWRREVAACAGGETGLDPIEICRVAEAGEVFRMSRCMRRMGVGA